MCGQPLRGPVRGRGPPGEAALRQPLVAEPISLTVIHKQLQGRRFAIAEDEDGTGERVVLEGFLTEPSQTIDSSAKVGWLDGDEDLHLGGDLEHQRAFQKLRERASMSAAS